MNAGYGAVRDKPTEGIFSCLLRCSWTMRNINYLKNKVRINPSLISLSRQIQVFKAYIRSNLSLAAWFFVRCLEF
jgi:hypothetical protein